VLGSAIDVAPAGNSAHVAAAGRGLRIIDVSDPSAPAVVGFYDTAGYARGVALGGDYAYVADSGGGLFILRFVRYEIYAPLLLRNYQGP
jgi:hypothetical protein